MPARNGWMRRNFETDFLKFLNWPKIGYDADLLSKLSLMIPLIPSTGEGTPQLITGTATQSSTQSSGPAGLAIDGNIDQNYGGGSCTHTQSASDGSFEWWKLDFGVTKKVTEVQVMSPNLQKKKACSLHIQILACRSGIAPTAALVVSSEPRSLPAYIVMAYNSYGLYSYG